MLLQGYIEGMTCLSLSHSLQLERDRILFGHDLSGSRCGRIVVVRRCNSVSHETDVVAFDGGTVYRVYFLRVGSDKVAA